MMPIIFRRTKLPENSNAKSADRHERLWELIPWFVNGTLPPEEAEEVKRYARVSPEFAAEISRQHGLAKQVATADPFDVPLARSWDHLRAQIKAEEPKTKPRFGLQHWLDGLRGKFVVAGALAAACLVVVAVQYPIGENLHTLTSNTADAPTIKFQVAPGLSRTQIEKLLAEHNLKLVSGPSEGGVYGASGQAVADPQAAAQELMRLPEILFAAPAGES